MRILTLALVLLASSSAVAESTNPVQIARVIDEGTDHSEVMVTAEHQADVIGPRMTNSPAMRNAETWTQQKFREWRLSNVHKEGFAFGRGWWIERSSVRMVLPRPIQLTAIPIAWTPPTKGVLTAPIIVAPMSKSEHFAKWHGKLAGKIVLVSLPGEGSEPIKTRVQTLVRRRSGQTRSL